MTSDKAVPTDLNTQVKVLLVDDDPAVLRALANILQNAGFETLSCFNSTDAMRLADDSVSAAILDIHLPDLNGLSLSRKLRETLRAEVPIIILSGDNSMNTIRALPDAGATYFFAKPVNTGMLIGKLKEWTGVSAKSETRNLNESPKSEKRI